MRPPYKTPQNSWYTEALFYEKSLNTPNADKPFKPPFTLINSKEGFTCFRTTFVDLGDPTGYKWAMRYLGDYEHWNRLLRCVWFQAAYAQALDELKTKCRAEALDKIRVIADGESAQALVAAKYLAGHEWEKGGRGRPSKSEITGELKKQAQLLTDEDLDAERIGLKVIK